MTNAHRVIRVAVPVPVSGGLDYLWQGSGPAPGPGCRVRVSVGRRTHVGVVLEHPAKGALDRAQLKSVTDTLDSEAVIDASLLAALKWSAAYYHHPIGEVVAAAMPALLRRGRAAARPPTVLWSLSETGKAIDTQTLARRAARQARLLELLAHTDSAPEESLRAQGYSRAELTKLLDRGWLVCAECSVEAKPADYAASAQPPSLTSDQRTALEAIDTTDEGFRVFLLHGVTGSGKTEIYMHLIAEQISAGKQSLLLVPEISLTPQLVTRLERRFGRRLAVMHSALTDRERLAAWQACRSGAAGLIVGTRSAVFAPLKSPGLVVVDEEHDGSFKQGEGFRYSARDLAVYRAQQLGLPVVLGSATPSLESYLNAMQHRYTLLRLPQRIGKAGEPKLTTIDMNRHAARDGLSTPLLAAIESHLSAGQQIMLFLNRRGFAPALFCATCRRAEDCPRCDARMTVHAARGKLRCHHCGAERPLSWACPSCGAERIAVGAGTQRVGEALRALFPNARIGRLDRDATSQRGSLERVLAQVESGDIQVLVGTQMLAKGHDFPNVTLVGVLNADQGLFGTDFRSNERLAQTIVQVAGRAGRADRPGEVLVQTRYPGHPLFEYLRMQDYAGFAELALAERRATGWPPYSHLIVMRAQAAQRAPVFAFLRRLAVAATLPDGEVLVHGPAAAPMERLGGRYRGQILLQCTRRRPLHELVDALMPAARRWPEARKVRWSVDVDPSEL